MFRIDIRIGIGMGIRIFLMLKEIGTRRLRSQITALYCHIFLLSFLIVFFWKKWMIVLVFAIKFFITIWGVISSCIKFLASATHQPSRTPTFKILLIF